MLNKLYCGWGQRWGLVSGSAKCYYRSPCGSATNTAMLQVEQAAGDAEWPAGDIHHQGPQEGHSQQEVKGKVYLLAGFRIRIQNTGPGPDQLTWFNPDPIRIRNSAFYFLEHFLKSGVRLVGSFKKFFLWTDSTSFLFLVVIFLFWCTGYLLANLKATATFLFRFM